MVISKIMKGILAATIMTASMATTVQAADVSCPSASDVQGTSRALNTVMRQSKSSYFVFTAQPALNTSGLNWMVLSMASGNGFDAAYTSAANDVKAVAMAANEEPIEQQGVYICAYFTSAGGMSVMAVAQQQQGLTFNPSMLKLDAIRANK